MMDSKLIKKILFVVGSLILGALGSGLWEIGKPALIWLGQAVLDVATLGLSSLQDRMYIEIARGTYERVSERTLAILFGVVVGSGIVVLSRSLPRRRINDDLRSNMEMRRNLHLGSLVVLASLLLAMSIQAAQLIYINRAANHMEQMLRVAAPFQSDRDRLLYISRFASMATRQEYVKLTSELSDVAKKNNVRVPQFNIY